MFCPRCRAELSDDAKYCIKCGYDFAKIKTPSPKKSIQDSLDGLGTSIQQELEAHSFRVGTHFADRYEILSEGLKGGMGVVYKCKDTMLNGKIKALKVIHPRLLSSRQAQSRFRQEVAISQELNHENIVRVYDIEEWEGKEYFTMEWVEGVSLREIITERKKQKRPFSIEEAYKIISQLADALHHAHRLTIHRDIKPENILISGKEQKVKLTDFGIAKMLSPSQFTSTSIQMGTPYYMAPEQKIDAANVDKRADIYALGVVLFELITLENTIGLELPSEINKELPPIVDKLIKRAIATKPYDRYGDAIELSDAVKKVFYRFSEQAERSQKESEEQKIKEEAQRRLEAEERKQKEAAQRKREEDLKRQEEERRAKEELERKKIEEQKQLVETGRTKTEETGKRTPFYLNRLVIVVAVLIVIIGGYAYKSRINPSTGSDTSPPAAEAPAPASAPYGYDMVPSKGWVPTPAPAPAPETAPSGPIIKNLRPNVVDEYGRSITHVEPGRTIELVMGYDIVFPKSSESQQVEVVEYNTLVAPNGKKIDNDNSILTRTGVRSAGGQIVGITVTLPLAMPDGPYTHVAIVRLKDKEYRAEQKILIQ